MTADPRQVLGGEGERAAERFLRGHGYVIVERNYRCALGEIDLIALDGRTVVFVEVKTRRDDTFGSPFEAVTPRKQRQIARAATYFLRAKRLLEREVRFDVVAIRWEAGEGSCELIRGAFEAPP